jgi:putative ABC transport system permease protein
MLYLFADERDHIIMNYIIKELRNHPGRTIGSVGGYTIATLFIILFLSVTQTNDVVSTGILKGTGTHFIVYVPSNVSCCVNCNSDSSNGSLYAEGVNTLMLTGEIIDSIKKIEGIRDAVPYLLYKIYDPRLQSDISLGGIEMNSIATTNNVCAATNIISGKFLSENSEEVVAEESFAMAHNLTVGDTLRTYGGKLILAGIVNSGIKPGKADLYAPINYVRRILKDQLKCISPGFDLNIVLVEVTSAKIQNQVLLRLKEKMKYLSVSSYNCYQSASDVMKIMEKTSALISVLVLIFLIVFSAKTQLTSLLERFREIGILKSLGWSNRKLGRQIIYISLVQAFTGASIGIILGFLIIQLLGSHNIRLFNQLEFQFQFRYSNILPLIVLSLAGGLIAGIFPVIKLYRTRAGDMINNYM